MTDREIVRALGKLSRDVAKTGREPSRTVYQRAAEMVSRGLVSEDSWPAIVYRVKGREGDYSVTLTFDGRGYVVLDRCTCDCEAGRAKRTCSHLLGALARAYHLGYRLETE